MISELDIWRAARGSDKRAMPCFYPFHMPIVPMRGTKYASRERAEQVLVDIYDKHPLARCTVEQRDRGFVVSVRIDGLRGYWREPFDPIIMIGLIILIVLMLLADRLDLQYGAHARPTPVDAFGTSEGVP